MNVALVYDRINKWGGAERVLMALHEMWPEAPLYTAVYDPDHARWADVFTVRATFAQYVPFAKNHHEWFPWLTPMAFESFSFDTFDVVISVTSAEAKYVITKPHTLHICYCLTPTRYLWSGHDMYAKSSRILKKMTPLLRKWDIVGSSRPDHYIAISEEVARRIALYYRRDVARVIYPPVHTDIFTPGKSTVKGEYFLTVSRLVGYKRVDLIIEAFNKLGWPLIIIGDGRERRRLMQMAGKNIRFIRSVTDVELARYYQKSRAFVFAGDEDFGIAAAEAQAAGIPVIAYNKGGLAEIVLPGKTGELFDEQSAEALAATLEKFSRQWYDNHSCRINAERFSKVRFMREMKDMVQELYNRSI